MASGTLLTVTPTVPNQNWWDGLVESWLSLPIWVQAVLTGAVLTMAIGLVASVGLWAVSITRAQSRGRAGRHAEHWPTAKRPWWAIVGHSWVTLPRWVKATHSSFLVSVAVLGVTALLPSSVELAATPSELDFGAVLTGTETIGSVGLANLGSPGSAPIEIRSWSISGPDADLFRVVDGAALRAETGRPASLEIGFRPDGAGVRTATLTLEHTGINSPMAIPMTGQGAQALRFNAGGPDIPGSPHWMGDSAYVSTSGSDVRDYTTLDISLDDPSLPVGTPPALFSTQRTIDGPELNYEIPVRPGDYEVRLYFADAENSERGERSFDVFIEDEAVLEDYDIVADVGPSAAVMKAFIVGADEHLTIAFRPGARGSPTISAIEVVDVSASDRSGLRATATDVDLGPGYLTGLRSGAVRVTNSGNPLIDPVLNLESVRIDGSPSFSVDNPGEISLGHGRTIEIGVRYRPEALGPEEATLTINHSGSGSPLLVRLTGFAWAATDDNVTTREDTSIDINVLANDGDPSGAVLSVALVGRPNSGTARLTANNTVVYTPAPNFSGAASFTYTVSDGTGGIGQATVNVTVTAVNDPPVVGINGPYEGATDLAINFSSAGSRDSDGSISSYEWTFGDGSSSREANPTHKYETPGTYTVTLTVTDNGRATARASTTARVDPPRTFSLSVSRTGTGRGTVTSSPSGINCGSGCSNTYESGTGVTLTATPDPGHEVTAWAGACSGTGTTCTLSMTNNHTASVTFSPIQRTLEVTPPVNGTVFGPGISCPSDCTESYPNGTEVTLTAAPDPGYEIESWSGSCSGAGTLCSLTMTANHTASVTFSPIQRTLEVTPPVNGTVFGPGISCPSDCTESYPNGTEVTLTAAPDPGYEIESWSGSCSGAGTLCSLTMTANHTASVTFKAIAAPAPTLSVSLPANGTITGPGITCGQDCEEAFPLGTVVTLNATPDPGFQVGTWGGSCSGTAPTCDLTMTTNHTASVTFAPI